VLLESVVQTFPSYGDRRPIQRQVARTIVPDIFWLGYSLANKSPAKDMDKFLIRQNSESVDSTPANNDNNQIKSSLHDLLVVVADLKNKVIKHDSEISFLKELNSTLQTQFTLLTSVTLCPLNWINYEGVTHCRHVIQIFSSPDSNSAD
jgi:hypothetical protein